MFFKDRWQAGELLAKKLFGYRGGTPLILAVPRGGLPVALLLWRELGGELDLLITRKIGAPTQPELAIGAVAGDGYLLLNDALVERLHLPAGYLEHSCARERAEIKRRLKLYRGRRAPPVIAGRRVILVDDGVATGFTLRAALQEIRRQHPRELVLAIPVGPPETLRDLAEEVDKIYFLEAPSNFTAVGQFYEDFRQVEDREVIAILREAWNEDGE
ncbi:MAG: phosphoribosyltransferase [Firmicutes bacterium]|nr:phosphoribosyltransferase [Bacillota bacterium]